MRGPTPYTHESPEQSEAEETLLTRLEALNAERAAEEARGIVRWLRPEFQNPQGSEAEQETLIAAIAPEADGAAPAARPRFPHRNLGRAAGAGW